MEHRELLERTCVAAMEYLERVERRPVGRPVDFPAVVAGMDGCLPLKGQAAGEVIECLRQTADPGLVATAGPRYFGFVVGGALPVAVAAEWLTTAWDQNAFANALSPAAAAAEEVVRRWMVELFGLPADTSAGFTTGATMSNFVALAAARHALFARLGWPVEEQGLIGAPPISVITSEESHASIFASLQMLGLGHQRVTPVETDEQGAMRPDALRAVLATVRKPVLVCAQAGNVNTGAFDPVREIAGCVHDHDGWLHLDGAFGAWAAASPSLRHHVDGIELVDSLAVDCHKWLNVPYDSGLVLVRDRACHHAAMTRNAPYYGPTQEALRENHNWVPEASRRARGFAVYAALRHLGREGLADLVDRCCRLAKRMEQRLTGFAGIEILNDVVLNQVLVRFTPRDGGNADDFTAHVIRGVQEEGTCWLGGTTWRGKHAMRISVSNWSTTETDIDQSAGSILRCAGY